MISNHTTPQASTTSVATMAKDDTKASSHTMGPTSSQSQQQGQLTNNKQKRSRHHKPKFPPRNDINLQIETQLKQSGGSQTGKRPNGGRKNQISINHLLDFQSYKDLEQYQTNRSKRRGSSHRTRNIYQPPKIQLTGMRFINVNYKFVVDNRKQYRIQQLDPNVPFDIEDIIRIIVPKGNACPICLTDEPVAPRMITSCGHIICLKCVLSLLDSEVPKAKKTEAAAIVEKYRDCPLCSSIIRKKELKPVLIHNVDERFETPKVNNDVVLSLINRQLNKILAIPRELSHQYSTDDFPDIMNEELLQHSRIFKGNSQYLLDMYEEEKKIVKKAYEEEKLLYGDDDPVLLKKAIDYIDDEIDHWISKLKEPIKTHPKIHSDVETEESKAGSGTFYFYQTGFNASCVYVLAPLDMKVLKTTYGNYENLPSAIVASIENIRYEELNSETSLKKYKYLSHLPLGTQIGFLECNWNKNEFINQESWETYKADLIKRSKLSVKKFKKEERDKKRAMDEVEIKTRNFYMRENSGVENPDELLNYQSLVGGVGGLSIVDNREALPSLRVEATKEVAITDSEVEYQTTVWGTKIPKTDNLPQSVEESEDDWDAEEMIRKAKEEMNRQEASGSSKKKKKKKLVLLSS